MKPDIEIQIKESEVEIQVYYKKDGKPTAQSFEFETLKIINENNNLVLSR